MEFTFDLHTHTVASGHAYSTVQEMAKAAADKGLKLLGITEHAQGIPGTCDEIYFHNMRIIPRKMYGIDLMFGSEINIIDHDGTLSMEEKIIDYISGIEVAYKPEEEQPVQPFAKSLVEDYGYSKNCISTHPQFRVKARPSDTKK